ncbi:MAG: hypothetical protein ACOY46_17965 [Bacillota bacterium]
MSEGKGEQSLWYPYVINETEQNMNTPESKNGIKCKKSRLKNGELVLAVARYIIINSAATAKVMSEEFSATVQSVNGALRKIREKLQAGMAVPGLSDTEAEILLRAMEVRDRWPEEEKARMRGVKDLRSKVVNILREHLITRMFEEGNSISDIAGATGVRKRNVMGVLAKTGQMGSRVREMFASGHGVPRIASVTGLRVKEVRKILQGFGYSLGARKEHIRYFSPTEINRRKISTVKPSRPRSRKGAVRRKSTLSREGLADWNRMHYDNSGVLRLPYGCAPPADLPRKFPLSKAMTLQPKEPGPSFFLAPPPKAECSRRGRTRIGYMRFF